MSTIERIIDWANKTDMKTITVAMLKDWILEMEDEENNYPSDIMVLKIVSSFLVHQLNPNEPSMDLKDLANLNPEDLLNYEIPKELFNVVQYSEASIKDMQYMLSRIIMKMEDKKIDTV